MKRLWIAIAIIFVLAGCKDSEEVKSVETGAEKKQLTEQEIALRIDEVKSNFASKFNIDQGMLTAPVLFDITNDGTDEIVLYTEKEMTAEAENYYIGIYSINDGSELVSKQYESSEMIRISKLSNTTYHNSLAIFQFSAGASGASYTADVLAFQNNVLTSVASVTTECGGPYPENVLTDIDQDGFEEFKGQEFDYGPGSDRLSRADSVADDVVYSWNASTKAYEPVSYGEDGKTDDHWNSTGEMTKEKAVQIVQSAQKVQIDWLKPIETEDEVQKLMRPFFSNNFNYEFMQDGVLSDKEYNGYLSKYTESGDTTWLVPSYTSQAELQLEEDGIYAYLTEDIEQDYEGESFMVQAVTTLVKTKYGWKIDSLGYNESNKNEESSSDSNIDKVTIGDTENQLLETYGYDTPKELREGYTIYTVSKTQFYVDFVVKAIISEDGSYRLPNGISVGNTLKHVLDMYNPADFRNWEDSRIITAKMESGLIVGFDFGMSGGALVPEDSIYKIALIDEKFFETLYSETYEDKMKRSSQLSTN